MKLSSGQLPSILPTYGSMALLLFEIGAQYYIFAV